MILFYSFGLFLFTSQKWIEHQLGTGHQMGLMASNLSCVSESPRFYLTDPDSVRWRQIPAVCPCNVHPRWFWRGTQIPIFLRNTETELQIMFLNLERHVGYKHSPLKLRCGDMSHISQIKPKWSECSSAYSPAAGKVCLRRR